MIQAVIDRMARNSFALKGWSVTLAGGLLSLAAADSNRAFASIALYVIVALAGLDAYYLAMERNYRGLHATAATEADNAWGLAAGPVRWSDVLRAAGSPSVWLLHGSAAAAALVALVGLSA